MVLLPNGTQIGIHYVGTSESAPLPREPASPTGAWGAVLAFFGIKKAPPMPKRCASDEPRPDPAKLAREDGGDTAIVKQQAPAAPPKPFPILDLPFELLCEVIARLPPSSRHFSPPLGTICKTFRAAVNAVSARPNHREEDAIARRIGGIRWQHQIIPMLDEVANAKPSVREWAIRTLVTMTSATSEEARLDLMVDALNQAKSRSKLWEAEVMRHFARHLAHTDTAALNLLTERAVQWVPANAEERFARARVLAQLAQRISPNDVTGSVRRWESIYQLMSVSANRSFADYLTLRGLREGLSALKNKYHATFTVGTPTRIMLNVFDWMEAVEGRGSDPYIAACTPTELEYIEPPEPLPGTVPSSDSLRGYSSVLARKIPNVDRLPSHLT